MVPNYPAPTQTSLSLIQERYASPKIDGSKETFDEVFRRVAKGIAQAEEPIAQEAYEEKFYDLMRGFYFLPNSPTIVGAGKEGSCLSACFVMSPDDTMESIMRVGSDAAITEKYGGGVGFGLQRLQPS